MFNRTISFAAMAALVGAAHELRPIEYRNEQAFSGFAPLDFIRGTPNGGAIFLPSNSMKMRRAKVRKQNGRRRQ